MVWTSDVGFVLFPVVRCILTELCRRRPRRYHYQQIIIVIIVIIVISVITYIIHKYSVSQRHVDLKHSIYGPELWPVEFPFIPST